MNETQPLDEESVWLVRAGRKGTGEQIALENNIVGIGYEGFDRSIKDIKTFKQHYKTLHPNQKPGSVNRSVRQIWDFLHKMKIGDFVMLPLLARNSEFVAVGTIDGECQDTKLHPELTVTRPVKWLEKNVPKSTFDDDLVKSLGYRGTIYQLGGSAMIRGLRESLKNVDVTDAILEENMNGLPKLNVLMQVFHF